MAKGEKTHNTELKNKSPQQAMGVVLDPYDLHELYLRSLTAKWSPVRNGSFSRGAKIQVPIHAWTQDMADCTNALEQVGRAVHKDDRPRNGWQDSGNRVIEFTADESVSQSVQSVDIDAMQPILQVFEANQSAVDSVTIFPNSVSSPRLNGVVLQLNGKGKDHWKVAAQLNLSLGRGLQLTALPMGIYDFWQNSQNILGTLHTVADNSGGVKFMQVLFDENTEQVFLAVASGPCPEEAAGINAQLSSIHKRGEAQAFLEKIARHFAMQRERLSRILAQSIGLNDTEAVMNVPYIGVDVSEGQIYSGAVLDSHVDNGLSPLTLSNTGILVHRPKEQVVPIGITALPWSSKHEVPPGYLMPPPPSGSIIKSDSSALINAIMPEMALQTTALAYHQKLRKQPRKTIL